MKQINPFQLLSFIFLIIVTTHIQAQQPGTLDNTFDEDGKVNTPIAGVTRSAKIQDDNKILIAGAITGKPGFTIYGICRMAVWIIRMAIRELL